MGGHGGDIDLLGGRRRLVDTLWAISIFLLLMVEYFCFMKQVVDVGFLVLAVDEYFSLLLPLKLQMHDFASQTNWVAAFFHHLSNNTHLCPSKLTAKNPPTLSPVEAVPGGPSSSSLPAGEASSLGANPADPSSSSSSSDAVRERLSGMVPTSALGIAAALGSVLFTLCLSVCLACRRCRKRGKGEEENKFYFVGVSVFAYSQMTFKLFVS